MKRCLIVGYIPIGLIALDWSMELTGIIAIERHGGYLGRHQCRGGIVFVA